MNVPATASVRSARPEDYPAIRVVHEQAFSRPDEANLVDDLGTEGAVLRSFVAVLEEQIIGHILFTRMSIVTPDVLIPAVSLAPVAVLPQYQGAGVGTALIHHGLECLRSAGERIVLVLGERAYYGRFGFTTEGARPLASPFPADFYMALELSPRALTGMGGKVRYAAAFHL